MSPTLFRVPFPRPRAASRAVRRSTPLPAVLVAAALLLVGTSCTGDDGGGADQPAATPTPITDLEAADVVLARANFCDRIPDEAVTAAVGEVAATEHYGNGEKEQITPEVAGKYGFRPGDEQAKPAGLVTAANGADPSQPRRTLTLPTPHD